MQGLSQEPGDGQVGEPQLADAQAPHDGIGRPGLVVARPYAKLWPIVPGDRQAAQGDTQMSDDRPQKGVSSEYRKFGVLVAAFVVVVLAIAVLRPLIFNQIIPAILGLGETPLPAEPPADLMVPVVPVPPTQPPAAYPAGTAPTATLLPPPSPTLIPAEPTAPPPPEPTTHTIQQGETLYQIAALYGVSVADLAAANDIVNPNQIAVGTVLVIP